MADLSDLAVSVLDLAGPGESVEVYAVHTVATTVQAGAAATIRLVDRAETRGIGVRLFRDHRVGYASTGDLRREALEASVDRARANARASDPDPPNLPPDPHPATQVGGEALAVPPPPVPLADKIALVAEVVTAVEARDPRVRAVDTAEYRDEQREVVIASTRGVRAQHRTHRCELWVDALGEHPAGRASGLGDWAGRDPGAVDPDSLALEAVSRTVRLLGPPRPRPPDLPVLLDYSVVGDLLAAAGRACTGGALGNRRSPFTGMHGEQVGSPTVTLVDDGRQTSGPYDDEGTPRHRTALISGGVLTGALHSTATAHAMGDGSSSTGNARRLTHKSAPRAAPADVQLEPNTHHDQLLTRLGDGVSIQQLTGAGSGINAVTGRVDVGGIGWLLRGGEPAGPVATVPLSTDLVTLLRAVTHIADDARPVPDQPVTAATVACGPELLA